MHTFDFFSMQHFRFPSIVHFAYLLKHIFEHKHIDLHVRPNHHCRKRAFRFSPSFVQVH